LRNHSEKLYSVEFTKLNRESDEQYFGNLHKDIHYSQFQRVSDIPQFREYAEEFQWSNREEFADYNFTRKADIFDFIQQIYSDWLAAASEHNIRFTQADLFKVDEAAWNRLQQRMRDKKSDYPEMANGHMPNGLFLPNEKTASLSEISDPDELADAIQERELLAKIRARQRARQTPSPQ